jgi:hypothetical protein
MVMEHSLRSRANGAGSGYYHQRDPAASDSLFVVGLAFGLAAGWFCIKVSMSYKQLIYPGSQSYPFCCLFCIARFCNSSCCMPPFG